MKKLSIVFMMLIVLVVLSSCSNSSYTVLVTNDNSPYSFTDESGNLSGFEVDVLKSAAKAAEIEVKVTADTGSEYNCCSSLLTDNSDSFDYTSSYYDTAIIFAVKKKSKIYVYEQIVDQKIGVIKDSSGDEFAEQIAPQYNLNVIKYTDRNKMYKAVTDKKIIGCFDDLLILTQSIKDGAKLRMFAYPENSGSLSFAVNKGKNSKFITNLNKGIKTIKDNGELKKIAEKYNIELR